MRDSTTGRFVATLGVDDQTSGPLKAAGENAKKAAQGFESLAGKIVAIQAAVALAREAFTMVKDKIDELSEAYRQHDANHQLFLRAMEYSGTYSAAGAKGLTDYAEALQKVTGVDKMTTEGLAAQAKAIGLTNDQTKLAIEASSNLAAARGMSISDAFTQVIGTIHGTTDGLNAMVPALRHVNVEALATGAGFKIINDQFKGAATEASTTWQTYTARAAAAKEDILVSIGEVLDKGLGLTDVAKNQAEFWEKAAEQLDHFKSTAIAAMQAVRAGFTQVDWAGLSRQLTAVAMVLTVAFGPVLIVTLVQAAGAVAAFAATWVLVPVGIMASVAALDLVINNLDKLPELATLFGDIFQRALLNVRMIFAQLMLAITEGIEQLLSSIPGGEKMFGGMLTGLRQLELGLNDTVDNASDKFKALGDQIEDTWGKLDTGLAGKAITEVKSLADNVTGAFAKIKTAQANAQDTHSNKGPAVSLEDPRLQEQFALAQRQFRQFIAQGRQAQLESAKIGLTEAEALQAEFDVMKTNATDAYNLLVRYHGVSQVEADRYNKSLVALEAAKNAKIAEINKQAVIDGGKLYGAQLDNVTEGINRQLEDTTRALDEAARRDMDHWQDYQDAKVAAADKAAQAIRDNAPLSEKIGNAASAVGAAVNGTGSVTDATSKLTDVMTDVFMKGVDIFASSVDLLVNDVLSGKFVQMLADTLQQVGDLPNQLLKTFQNLGNILDRLISSLPQALNNFLQQLPSILQKIMAEIPKVIEMIAAMLPKIAKAFADAVPGMIGAIMDKLPDLIEGIVQAIITLLDKLPEIFSTILKKLPDIIAEIFHAIPEIINAILKIIPQMFESLADNIGPIVESLVEGIVTAVGSIIADIVVDMLEKGGLEKIVGSILRIIPQIIGAIFKGIWEALKNLWSMIMGKGGGFTAPQLQMPDPTAVSAKIKQVLQGSTSDLFKVEDFKTAAKNVDIGQRIADAANSAAVNISNTFGNLWKSLGAAIKAALLTAWHDMWASLITPIQVAFQWIEDHIVTPLMHVGSEIWGWVESHVVSPLMHVGAEVWGWVESHVVTPLMNAGQGVWSWVESHIVRPLTTIGQSAWQWVEDHIVKPIQNAFSGISNFKFPSFNWPAIQVPDLTIQKPSWWNLSSGGPVGGLTGRVSSIVNQAPGGQGVTGTTGKATGYLHSRGLASGGPVHAGVLYAAAGTQVMGTDTVPAMLTPGEYVINRHAASRAGMPALDSINAGNPPGGGGLSVNAPISIQTTQPIDENFIRNKLVPTFMDTLRRASENGKYVISNKGIRGV